MSRCGPAARIKGCPLLARRAHSVTQIRRGDGGGIGQHFRNATSGEQLTPLPAGAGANVHQVIRLVHDLLVVLDHHQRVAAAAGSLRRAVMSRWVSRGCRPTVGSSRM